MRRGDFRERRGAVVPRTIEFEGGGVQAVAHFRQQAQLAREASREAAANVVRAVVHEEIGPAFAVAAYVDADTELLRQPPQRGVDLRQLEINPDVVGAQRSDIVDGRSTWEGTVDHDEHFTGWGNACRAARLHLARMRDVPSGGGTAALWYRRG